jgi:hypothetical protein
MLPSLLLESKEVLLWVCWKKCRVRDLSLALPLEDQGDLRQGPIFLGHGSFSDKINKAVKHLLYLTEVALSPFPYLPCGWSPASCQVGGAALPRTTSCPNLQARAGALYLLFSPLPIKRQAIGTAGMAQVIKQE